MMGNFLGGLDWIALQGLILPVAFITYIACCVGHASTRILWMSRLKLRQRDTYISQSEGSPCYNTLHNDTM